MSRFKMAEGISWDPEQTRVEDEKHDERGDCQWMKKRKARRKKQGNTKQFSNTREKTSYPPNLLAVSTPQLPKPLSEVLSPAFTVSPNCFLSPASQCSGSTPVIAVQIAENDDRSPTPQLPLHTETYIDSHCHLDFMASKRLIIKDFDNFVERRPEKFPPTFIGCIPNFIEPTLFCPISPYYDPLWLVTMLKSKYVLGATYGCHPHDAAIYTVRVDEILRGIAAGRDHENSKIVAIGECGIDLFRCLSSLEAQKACFRSQLRIAAEHDLPVVVHCRDRKGECTAEAICLDILKEELPPTHYIHRHCYDGNLHNANLWMQAFSNIYFGLKPTIFQDSNPLAREMVRSLPLERLLLETDAPFFPPIRKSGKQMGVPGEALFTAAELAKVRSCDVDSVLKATRLNTQNLYRLNLNR